MPIQLSLAGGMSPVAMIVCNAFVHGVALVFVLICPRLVDGAAIMDLTLWKLVLKSCGHGMSCDQLWKHIFGKNYVVFFEWWGAGTVREYNVT